MFHRLWFPLSVVLFVAMCAWVARTAAHAQRAGGNEPQVAAGGIPTCPPGADKNLLSAQATSCWFKADHGGWRVLSHDGHYDTVVYHVAADDQADAVAIARAIVAGNGQPVEELLLYVYREPVLTSVRTRRVSWNPSRGYETLDFDGRVPRWLAPAQP